MPLKKSSIKPPDKGNNPKSSKNIDDFDCGNIRRMSPDDPERKCPDWHSETNYGVFNVETPYDYHTEKGKRARKAEWEKSGNPHGVYLPIALHATLGDITLVSNYNNFQRERDYTSFVDGPLADLISSFGRVMRAKFDPGQIQKQAANGEQG
ncbi:hypothetical protein ACHAPT_007076 [Fusarium lateritium]